MTPVLRRSVLATLAAIIALALTACAGLPVSGPVKLGRVIAEADEDPPVTIIPDAPSPGMTPQQVVEGFIAAGTGPSDMWATARLFLTEDFGTEWQPTAGVTVYSPGQRVIVEPSPGEVAVEITPEASVDATGVYAASTGQPVTLTYRLEQVGEEWRISEAPPGIVLDRNRFEAVFRSYSLMFFDPTWTFLVPDLRWFAIENNPATRIAEALIEGGAQPWLTASVRSAFVADAGLSAVSVPVRSQVAEVPLRPAARELDQTTLDRMQAQLEASLATAGVTDVDMVVDGQPLVASAAPVRTTRIDSRALVLTEGAFGFLSGAEIEQIPGLSIAVQEAHQRAGVDAIDVDADRRSAAVRTSTGEVQRVWDDSRWTTLDIREGLIAPAVDPVGYVFSVPADTPSALVAFGADGTLYELTDVWPGATRVYAMRVSRDGTRIAALVRDGAEPVVWVAGVVRDDRGVPLGLSDPQNLGRLPGDGFGIAWLDGSTLALLSEVEGERYVIEQPIGGASTSTRAPADTVAIGGNETGAVRVLDSSGQLFGQRGATWSPIVADIGVLAGQQGTPR